MTAEIETYCLKMKTTKIWIYLYQKDEILYFSCCGLKEWNESLDMTQLVYPAGRGSSHFTSTLSKIWCIHHAFLSPLGSRLVLLTLSLIPCTDHRAGSEALWHPARSLVPVQSGSSQHPRDQRFHHAQQTHPLQQRSDSLDILKNNCCKIVIDKFKENRTTNHRPDGILSLVRLPATSDPTIKCRLQAAAVDFNQPDS